MTVEATLAFRQEALFQMVVQAPERHASENVSSSVRPGNASVIVADVAVPFPPVDVEDCNGLEILRDFSLPDDDTMIDPPFGTRGRLGHKQVPLVSPPDEDIVHKVPLTRPRVPPGGL
nr:unnamed protein product [Spirometra erinaceieuropaei]